MGTVLLKETLDTKQEDGQPSHRKTFSSIVLTLVWVL